MHALLQQYPRPRIGAEVTRRGGLTGLRVLQAKTDFLPVHI